MIILLGRLLKFRHCPNSDHDLYCQVSDFPPCAEKNRIMTHRVPEPEPSVDFCLWVLYTFEVLFDKFQCSCFCRLCCFRIGIGEGDDVSFVVIIQCYVEVRLEQDSESGIGF